MKLLTLFVGPAKKGSWLLKLIELLLRCGAQHFQAGRPGYFPCVLVH